MAGRTCSKCDYYKTDEHFYVNGAHPDGTPRLKSVCKDCVSEGSKKSHVGPRKCTGCQKVKQPKEFTGKTSQCRKCRTEASNTYKKDAGRAAHNARMLAYTLDKHHNDPEYRLKQRARREVHLAVKYGVLVRPDTCPKCKRKARVQGHHYKGYDKPNWLKVKWLCARCHFKADTRAHGVETAC